MYLRSLVIKGFKSFADSVTIDLSPGVSVIVGPNGSGKSNIVDAIAWVLGAQGPKTVRSAKMDEVIFAGAGKRGPLGRAEVSIVIDNSDQVLGLDLTEITITRTLFRTGESEYALNGTPCRLIDLQDLLSDAGVGRQQHVIISQGQLDMILNARAEERRGVIEDAAGITKFKKRRERTERRLEAMEGDLTRAGDLVREVRRQIRPLAQQAQKAKRQLELRDRIVVLKRYLAGSEYRALESIAASLAKEQVDAEVELIEIQHQMSELDQVISTLEQDRPDLSGEDLVELISTAETVVERFRSLVSVAEQKKSSLADKVRGADRSKVVDSLSSEKYSVAAELEVVEHEIVQLLPDLERLEREEIDFRSNETIQISEKLEELNVKLSSLMSENGSLLSKRSAIIESLNRVSGQKQSLLERGERSSKQLGSKRNELDEVTSRLGLAGNQLTSATEAKELASTREEALRAELDGIEKIHGELELSVGSLQAKVSAYESAIEEGRAKTQAKALEKLNGSLGALVDLIEIKAGYEAAFAAAVQQLSDSVLTKDALSSANGLRHLKEMSLQGSLISVTGQYRGSELEDVSIELPIETMRSVVSTSNRDLSHFLDRVLSGVYVVATSLDEAIEYYLKYPKLVFVTAQGERLGPDGVRTASRPMRATGIALDKSREELGIREGELDKCSSQLVQLREKYSRIAKEALDSSVEFDRIKAELASLEGLPERLESDIWTSTSDLEQVEIERRGLGERETELSSELLKLDPQLEVQSEELARLRSDISSLQNRMKEQFSKRRELDTRRSDLELKAVKLEQRRLGLEREKSSLELRLSSELAQQQSSNSELATWRRLLIGLQFVIDSASRFQGEGSDIVSMLRKERSILVAEAQARLDRISQARAQRSKAEKDQEAKRDALQLCSIRQSEARVRLETMGERIRRELGIETEIAMNTPVLEGVHPTQAESVLSEFERELSGLGAINELAEIELAELTERSQFLESQLEDVKGSRRELVKVIRAIDAEMLSVFELAFSDVSRNFSSLFEKLFPGGKGELVLSDPSEPLGSGLEIEVALPGKSVKRMSLLSGGERSLVALAFLFSIFESRPSPFYILDEVEAALDDINLNRFLRLITSFGKKAQLLVISHQKRTMEVADILYGVTIQEGGSTRVVSQKLSQAFQRAQ